MLPFYTKGDNEFAGKIDSQYSFISETSSDIPLIDYHLKSTHFRKTCQTILQGRNDQENGVKTHLHVITSKYR